MTGGKDKSIETPQNKCFQSNAHLCGLLARASNALLHCRSIEKSAKIFCETLVRLDISGCFSIGQVGLIKHTHFLGKKLGNQSFDGLLQICNKNQKVCASDHSIVVTPWDIKLLGAWNDL